MFYEHNQNQIKITEILLSKQDIWTGNFFGRSWEKAAWFMTVFNDFFRNLNIQICEKI